jgi:pyruvate kinase
VDIGLAGMRHTKIIATVGPASESSEVLEALLVAGVDVFRLNFSHGTRESHGAACAAIRAACRKTGRHAAVMQDLIGPKMRNGPVPDGKPLQLGAGD